MFCVAGATLISFCPLEFDFGAGRMWGGGGGLILHFGTLLKDSQHTQILRVVFKNIQPYCTSF